MSQVRLYGRSKGRGSYRRVTDGMRAGLEANGALAGVLYVDDLDMDDEEIPVDGYDAPIAVFVGSPKQSWAMASRGQHKTRLAMVPPNSTWMPFLDEMTMAVRSSIGPSKWTDTVSDTEIAVNGFIGPSTWAVDILRKHVKQPVELWHHGVSPAFVHDVNAHTWRASRYEQGEFNVVHFTSTGRMRKGTDVLLQAWERLMVGKSLPDTARLYVVAPGVERMAERSNARGITYLTQSDAPDEDIAQILRSAHVVCQPSRGEGFGFVPLEARACGTPVVATACTGHSDHMPAPLGAFAFGCVIVRHGELANIDDGPGALAPSVSDIDIAMSLHVAHMNWRYLADRAMDKAGGVQKAWDWAVVTKRWLEGRSA